MLDNIQIAQKLKAQLSEIHSNKPSPRAVFEAKLRETHDLYSLLLLAGNEYFYHDLPASSLSEDKDCHLLPFAYILAIYQHVYSKDAELQQLKIKYNQPFDANELNQDCKRLFQKVDDQIGLYYAIAEKMPHAIFKSSYSADERIQRNKTALMALSFLPEDHDLASKIYQMATANYKTRHAAIMAATNQFIQIIKPNTQKEAMTKEEFIYISNVINDFNAAISAVNVKIMAGQTKVSLEKLQAAAIVLSTLSASEDKHTQAIEELLEAVQELVNANAENLPFKDGKTLKKQQLSGQKFVNNTKDFREHIEDYATKYLQLTDEKQKEDFKTFIDVVYQIDKDFVAGKIPSDLSVFEMAFSAFEKITDPDYHKLTDQEIDALEWKRSVWAGFNFLASLSILSFIVTAVLLPWFVFVPVLIVSLVLMHHSNAIKEPLYEKTTEQLEKNEFSQARVTFKNDYGNHFFSLPQSTTNESLPETQKIALN